MSQRERSDLQGGERGVKGWQRTGGSTELQLGDCCVTRGQARCKRPRSRQRAGEESKVGNSQQFGVDKEPCNPLEMAILQLGGTVRGSNQEQKTSFALQFVESHVQPCFQTAIVDANKINHSLLYIHPSIHFSIHYPYHLFRLGS